jgi:hypothetical protein
MQVHKFITYFFKCVEKTVNLQENVNPDLVASMTQGVPSQLTGINGRQAQVQDAIPAIAPKWLKYDRQVSTLHSFTPQTERH